MRMWTIILLGMSLSGCAGLFDRILKEPKVSLERVDLVDVELSKATLMFILKVENPNGIDIVVDEVNYQVFLEDKAFSSAKTDRTLTVPKNGQAEIALPLPVEYKRLWGNVMQLLSSRTLNYRIEGDAKLSAFRIPFKDTGKVDLKN